MAQRITRRGFLKLTGGAAAAAATVSLVPQGLARSYAANERVNVASIGVGGMGEGNLSWLDGLKDAKGELMVNMVGLCDVDSGTLDKACKTHPKAQRWVDYRQMLEKQKEIDAVMISTPDHSHFPASMMAIKLGKAVDTEKPLTHSIWEARELAKAAKEYKVATQLDQEGHARDGLRRAVEWIKAGVIGKVGEVHIFTDRPIWPQGLAERPPTKPVPANLNWDLWLGPAPQRDYHEHLHPFQWRGWWDFGTGALGDMGCHFFDLAFWALDLGKRPAKTVEAVFEGKSKETYPKWSIVTYQFPALGDLPPVTLKWWDGHKLPDRPAELDANRKFPENGSMFVGEKGKILVIDTDSPRLLPEEKMKGFEQPKPFLPRVRDHKGEWLDAVRGGPPASSNFTDYGGPLAECVLLGNLAIAAGKKIDWDNDNLKATNAPEVAPFIHREYRKGWDI
jgi:predicted dehydrogenase